MEYLRQHVGGVGDQRLTVALGVAVTAVAGGYLAVRLTRPRKNIPPGPRWAWPLLGNALEMNNDSMAYFDKLCKEYGTIFSFKLGTDLCVVLHSVEAIREAFIHNGMKYVGRPTSRAFDHFSMGQKDIVFGQYGPLLRAQRKILHEALRKYSIGDKVTDNIASAVQESFDHIKAQTEAFDPALSINLLFYNLIAQMTFGQKFTIDDKFFLDMIHRIDEFNEAIGVGLLSDVIPGLAYTQIMKSDRMLKWFVNDFLVGWIGGTWRKHKENFDPNNLSDFTYHLVATMKEVEKEEDPGVMAQFTDEHFIQMLSDMFFAGTDTSRITTTWFILYMAAHPEVQAKVQEEVDAVVGRDRPVEMGDWRNLHYTYAVLHEVMRMRPMAAHGVPRKVVNGDTTLCGFDIPNGTIVVANVYAVHHDPALWENPDEFKPDRFLDDFGNFITQPAWMPFSTGRRVCIGESFAKPELTAVCASLMQKLTFSCPIGETLTFEWLKIPFTCQAAPFKVVAKER